MSNQSSSIDLDRLGAIVRASSDAHSIQEAKNELLKSARRELATANAAEANLELHFRSPRDGVPVQLAAAREATRKCRLNVAAAERDHKIARDQSIRARRLEVSCREYAGRQRIHLPDETGRNLPREFTTRSI
jgi:hypothetical protein